jgi:hypothetical protein
MKLRITAAILVAVGIFLWYTLPPRPLTLPSLSNVAASPRGVIHVHTRRSDGTGRTDDIATAAARAGLKFVVFTDHGDATRQPDRPVYLHGVLCIDAVEISTDGGHLVALGLPPAPYPLGGDPRDVIEDVHRLGGFAIPAHPGSAKPALRWLEWMAPFDGIEWLNADSEWRDEQPKTLAHALLAYPLRGAAALGLLLNRPDDVLHRWDGLASHHRITAVAASDAHARLGLRSSAEPYTENVALPIPSYEQVFRAFSISLPQLRLSGDAATDARALLTEIRSGHVYSSVEALAAPAMLSFTARSGDARATGGDLLPPAGPVAFHVSTNAPRGAEVRLLKDGSPIANSSEATLDFQASAEPAVYRVEVRLPARQGSADVPWILSNPVYVRVRDEEWSRPARAAATTARVLYGDGPATAWTIENSAEAAGAIDVVGAVPRGTQLLARYALGGSDGDASFVALSVPVDASIVSYDRVTFTARADRPMRVSVQLRRPGAGAGERWRRSVYLDQDSREVSVFFDEMRPADATTDPQPALAEVRSLLFVIDSVNTKLGASGQFWIDDVKLGR